MPPRAPNTEATRATASPRHRWLPRQHGAWAMLLVPVLVGVAASRPYPWHLVLAGAALTAYLVSASVQAWIRSRRPRAYRAPIVIYGGLFAILGLTLVVAFPALLLTLVVAGPAAVLALGAARPGSRRDLVNRLAQVVQALVLVPAAAYVSGSFEVGPVVSATAVAAAYLVGTVLVVRSVLRERGNATFAALSVGFHVVLVGLALAVLPPAYAVVASALALRALALPILQRRLAAGPRPLRPIHVGLVEIAASIATVAVVFLAPP